MARIEGRIIQIISPSEISHYFWTIAHSFLKGKYIIVIERKDLPQNIIGRVSHNLHHLGENAVWSLISDPCEYKVGDIAEFPIDVCYNSSYFLTVAR